MNQLHTTSKTNHFSYQDHLRLAINIGIARSKLSAVITALNMAYPFKILSVFPDNNFFATNLKSCMENILRKECSEIKSHNARCVYFSGIGGGVYDQNPLSIIQKNRLDPYGDLPRINGRKPGVNPEEYIKIKTVFMEVNDLFQYYEDVLNTVYPDNSEPAQLCSKLAQNISRIENKLEERLKNRHGEFHSIFNQSIPESEFLSESVLVDLSPYWEIIKDYLKTAFLDEYEEHFGEMCPKELHSCRIAA